MALRTLFATPILEANLADRSDFPTFNAELAGACLMLADEDQAGRAWSRANGYRGYTSYASLNDLPTRASIFGKLKTRLDKLARGFADDLHLELGTGRLVLDNMWVNVMKAGATHSGHIHPHSVISGTVYVATPPGASGLKLEDPRLAMMMAAPPRRADAPDLARTFVYLTPEPGTVFMWESWLRHEVPPNTTKNPRISLSFNYAWR